LLGHRRDKVKRVLEIGVHKGASLRMWEEYFPNAEIVGVDIDEACLFNAGRIRCYHGNQSDVTSLIAIADKACREFGLFDLIVDDGSHLAADQIKTAWALLPFLAKGGIYVCEDIEIDCKADLIGEAPQRPKDITVRYIKTGIGLGSATRCAARCTECQGTAGEVLVVWERAA
jgi:predicted O-methyltransferase YrrM